MPNPTGFLAKPGTPGFIAELDKIDPQGDWTVAYKGIAATSYQDETGAQINVANEAGNWEHKDDNDILIGQGDNLQSLYAHLKGDTTTSFTAPTVTPSVAPIPPPAPHKAVGDNLQFAKMKQTVPKLGSNSEISKHQDEDGKEYYIKQFW